MIKKLALVLALLMFSSPAHAIDNLNLIWQPKIVTPDFCKNIYDSMAVNLKILNLLIGGNAPYKDRDPLSIRLAHLSTIYKNLCKNYNVTRK